MSKSIIVIDTPSRCCDCRLADFGKCWGSNSYLHLSTKDRPKECPLRPLPQKRILPEEQTIGTNYGEEPWFSDGFNACLDEILGGTE